MRESESAVSMEHWLGEIRTKFVSVVPQLLPLYDTYAAEALFGRRYIDSDIGRVPPGGKILEVGAGSLLLSCQLMREGYQVTALEPTGDGFSHFDKMRQIVLDEARSQGGCPTILDLPAEHLAERNRFDYAFSVNVMEHVDSVAHVLETVGNSLVVGASYRFTCPNYLFPYEPHFNIPTFFSKRLTERLLGRRIFGSQRVPDPLGTWMSLNWINVIQIRRCVRRLPGFGVRFNRSMLISTLGRIVSDPDFAARRSPCMKKFLSGLVFLRLHYLLVVVPALFQPIIDCRLKKIYNTEKC